jgi:hypothetical protein
MGLKREIGYIPEKIHEDAAVRLVAADWLEVAKPIVDFYDLCSYSVEFCYD